MFTRTMNATGSYNTFITVWVGPTRFATVIKQKNVITVITEELINRKKTFKAKIYVFK